jgi:hypothetical protein
MSVVFVSGTYSQSFMDCEYCMFGLLLQELVANVIETIRDRIFEQVSEIV